MSGPLSEAGVTTVSTLDDADRCPRLSMAATAIEYCPVGTTFVSVVEVTFPTDVSDQMSLNAGGYETSYPVIAQQPGVDAVHAIEIEWDVMAVTTRSVGAVGGKGEVFGSEGVGVVAGAAAGFVGTDPASAALTATSPVPTTVTDSTIAAKRLGRLLRKPAMEFVSDMPQR
ncbi:hypothetical protein GCM10023322_58420 [Rugosimonospora acidiphila]|uniref:Uncharacterized protein n=1 Tax=Rugosimonospora acidiphila TaxID=556531 RepID=A0ABP9SE45_9ACTN